MGFTPPAMIQAILAVLLMGFGMQTGLAESIEDANIPPISISQMKIQATAPRVFIVTAYVMRKDDVCPPCPPHAVCETCELGIRIADSPDTMDKGIYLATPQAAQFQLGAQYLFRIRYQIIRNAAGAWQLEGPQLLDYSPVKSGMSDQLAP